MTAAEWLSSVINEPGKFDDVVATVVSDCVILLKRQEKPDQFVGIAPIQRSSAKPIVTRDMVQQLIDQESQIVFMLAIPKIARWSGEAISRVRQGGIAFGGVGDLFSAISDHSMANYRNSELAFVEDGLTRHTCVHSLEFAEDRLIHVQLSSGRLVNIALCNEYDITMSVARNAGRKFGEFDVLLKTNPNGSVTSNGAEQAEALGFQTLKWGELLGFLARRGRSGRTNDLKERLRAARSV